MFVFPHCQRMKTLDEVRNMRAKAYEVQVYREQKWAALMSDQLVPGDIVSLPRPKDDNQV
jgi:cation-transporting ATPase 13A1